MPGNIDPKEIAINPDAMNLVYKYFWNIPTIQMCRNMIRQHLFCNGIEFKGKSGANANNFSQNIMEDFWLPFCEDALDSAMTYGFVVWRTRKVGDTIVPIVCLKDTYRLTIKEENGVIEYNVYDTQEKNNEILKGAYVYDEFGYRPEIDGDLMSMLHTLIPDIQYYFTMLNCQVMLERKRVRPPILTQLQSRSNGGGATGENEGIDYDFYADADIAEAEEESKYKRNKQAIEALKNQQRLYDEFFDTGNDDAEINAPDILDQMVPIPSGQTLASYQIQQGRNDMPNILKQLQDTICGVLGVPKSMIMSDTPHKSDAVGTHQMFQTTIVWWKRQMSEMCQMIYNIINAKELSTQVGAKLNNRSSKADSKDIYLMTKKMSSRITFPTTPFTSNEELYQFYTQGVIDWKTYCTYISRNTSIPMDTIPEEPLAKKEKKELLGISKDPPKQPGTVKDPNDPKASVNPGEEVPGREKSPLEEKEAEQQGKEKDLQKDAEKKSNVTTDDKVNKAVGDKKPQAKPAGKAKTEVKQADTKTKDSKTATTEKKPLAKNDDKKAPPKKEGKKDEKDEKAKKGGKDSPPQKKEENKKSPPKKDDDKKDKKPPPKKDENNKKRKADDKESDEEKKKKKKKKDDKKSKK